MRLSFSALCIAEQTMGNWIELDLPASLARSSRETRNYDYDDCPFSSVLEICVVESKKTTEVAIYLIYDALTFFSMFALYISPAVTFSDILAEQTNG